MHLTCIISSPMFPISPICTLFLCTANTSVASNVWAILIAVLGLSTLADSCPSRCDILFNCWLVFAYLKAGDLRIPSDRRTHFYSSHFSTVTTNNKNLLSSLVRIDDKRLLATVRLSQSRSTYSTLFEPFLLGVSALGVECCLILRFGR